MSQYPPQNYYPQPVYVEQPKGKSLTSMILGLVSVLMGWTVVVPAIGLVLGFVGLAKEPAGRGLAITGIILNGLMVIGWLILLFVLFVMGAALFGAAANDGGNTMNAAAAVL